VNGNENPPICKLDNYINVLRNIKEKESEQRKKAKANVMKEISIGVSLPPSPPPHPPPSVSPHQATIDTHDLNIKMKKVNEFLDRDYQVRLIIFASKYIMEKKPLAIDETTLKVLDYLERFSTGPVMPSSKSADRVDFILSPKQRLYKDSPATTPPPPPTGAP
jgi:translation initiation factor IF-3